MVILEARADYGLSKTEEQLAIIDEVARRFKPNVVIIESDAQQKGLANDDRLERLSHIHGFRIHQHITRMVKMDIIFGVASMDQSFAKGEIRIPWGDDATRVKMEPFVKQLREWRPDIPTKRLRQDLVMAMWFVHKYWQQYLQNITGASSPVQSRPSWVRPDPRFRRGAA